MEASTSVDRAPENSLSPHLARVNQHPPAAQHALGAHYLSICCE